MAYINKDSVIDIIDNSADIQEAKSCVLMLDNADVIERADYDKVVQTYKLLVDLKELRVIHQEDIINDLHSKIDKAIEEITGYTRFHRDKIHNDVERGKYLAYEKSLEILKRNIGD